MSTTAMLLLLLLRLRTEFWTECRGDEDLGCTCFLAREDALDTLRRRPLPDDDVDDDGGGGLLP